MDIVMLDTDVAIEIGDRTFVCSRSRPLTLPIAQTWEKPNSSMFSGRPFTCLMDTAGVLWTNGSRGNDDYPNVFRRVTWRETLNLVQAYYRDILGGVIGAAATIQPHLIGMMAKYGEFRENPVVQGFLGGNDGQV